MPDDPVFDTPAPAGDPPPATPPPAAGVTPEQLAEALKPIVDQQAQLAKVTQDLAQKATPPPAPPEPATPWLDKFAADPEGSVKELIASEVSGLGPVLSTLNTSGHKALLGVEAAAVEERFGPGSWAKYFDKQLEPIWDAYRKQNPTALSDQSILHREVTGLVGESMDALIEHRDAHRKAQEESALKDVGTLIDRTASVVEERTNLSGGLRRMDTGGPSRADLDGIRQYLAERQAAIGGEETPEQMAKRVDYGNTLEDYDRHQEKLAAEGK